MTKGFLCLTLSFLSRKQAHVVCLGGGLHPGEGGSILPEPCTAPQGHPNWSCCSAVMANQSQGAKAIIARVVCSAAFQEPAQETKQSKAGTISAVHPSPPSKLEFLIHTWTKGSSKEFTRAEALQAQPLGGMCQLQEWQDRAAFGISPLEVLFCFFSLRALAKGRWNRIISKRKPGNGGQQ